MSVWTVRRQLERLGYTSTLPRGTPMLTQQHKNARVQWAIKHKNDDWSRTIFTDETCYQLFRNTIRRWSLNPSAEVKRIPKNRQKIMVWGGISIKGLIGCHSFRNIMDGPYFIRILQDHLFLMRKINLAGDGEFMGNHRTSYRKMKTRKYRRME